MSETKVIEENGLRITVIYEIFDEDAFNSLVEEMDYEEPDAHPFDNGPTSLSDAQKEYDYWKAAIACPDGCFSVTEVYAFQEVYRRKISEYKSGVRKSDPVFALYEELLSFFEDCYGDIHKRVQDPTCYNIYHVISDNYNAFSEVLRLLQNEERMKAFKFMDETIENVLAEIRYDN